MKRAKTKKGRDKEKTKEASKKREALGTQAARKEDKSELSGDHQQDETKETK